MIFHSQWSLRKVCQNDFDKDIIIDFRTDELQNDTIKFQVHSKKASVTNYLDTSINQGKLIKIK